MTIFLFGKDKADQRARLSAEDVSGVDRRQIPIGLGTNTTQQTRQRVHRQTGLVVAWPILIFGYIYVKQLVIK